MEEAQEEIIKHTFKLLHRNVSTSTLPQYIEVGMFVEAAINASSLLHFAL